jgi:hypothetical protein
MNFPAATLGDNAAGAIRIANGRDDGRHMLSLLRDDVDRQPHVR